MFLTRQEGIFTSLPTTLYQNLVPYNNINFTNNFLLEIANKIASVDDSEFPLSLVRHERATSGGFSLSFGGPERHVDQLLYTD